MNWFRFYHSSYRNPKVQEMRPELFKFWVNFLCVASESETRGTIPSEAHLRLALGLTKATVKRYCSELEGLVLLHRSDTGALAPHDWDKLQPPSDDAAKRKRDERARTYEKEQSEMSRDVSRDKNVTVTSRVREELEVEVERDKEEESPQPPSRGRAGKKTVDLPDWMPSEEWRAYLEMRGRIRKPATERAKELAIAELDRLQSEGHDPAAVLRQSVLNSWQGVFPVRANGIDYARGGGRSGAPSEDQVRSLTERLKGASHA